MASNGATESASKVEADNRKIFVGGIHREATQEELRAVMEQFGAVKDATIKIDPMGMSRGFGFVLFEEEASVDACLAAGDLTLKDKKMEAKRAAIKEIKQIFVGGVNPQMEEKEIRTHFEQFGEIETMDLPKDSTRGTRRGFVFITFKTVEACNAATASPDKQQLGENQVDVRKAVPYKDKQAEYHAGGGGGGYYDYGAAYGAYGAYGAYPAYPAYPPAPYGMVPYPRGRGGMRGAPRGGMMPGYPPYDPYGQSAWYGYPAAPGGGKMMRGRGRGRGAAQ